MSLSFKNLNNILAWLVWAVATYTYCSTIEPTASFWDCGEYIACSYKLEVGHPPGAPFFLLLGRFFAVFGGDNPANAAMMINIMSALASSFTILFLFWTITRLALKVFGRTADELSQGQQWAVLGAGIVGGLAYTFSDSFWFSAVEGEVYAMSSFFTALVFWAILKWDEEDTTNPTLAMRWIVFISYMMGLSIGVHLLNLLVIPAIAYVIYFKKYTFSWKGFFICGIASVLILGTVQNLIIPKVVKFAADYEVFFTNKAGMGFNTGTLIYFILLITSITSFIIYTIQKNEKAYKLGFYSGIVFFFLAMISAPSGSSMAFRLLAGGAILYGIHKYKTKTITLNTIFLSLATLLIGYSSFFVLVIRSQANTPMDENDPENAPNMLSYLLREQYGDWPVLYGQYYNAPTVNPKDFGSGDPIYMRDKTPGAKKYIVIDDRKNSIPKYEKEFCTIFPRMWSSQSHHESAYKYWGDVARHHKNKLIENSRTGEPETVEIPTFAANLNYFFFYQLNYMYWRYFFWNFVGRQNDQQGLLKNTMEGNWVTGIKGFDNARLDSDTSLVINRDKDSKATNHFYALPFLLGLFGAIFHFRRKVTDAWVVLAFFLLTGIAIVIYLNQTPYQPRERDYAYAGSFYAFAIWIGFGVITIYDFISKRAQGNMIALGATAFSMIVPWIMAKEGWDDHNRSLRTLSRDCAINYLQSCAPNAILFTNGDNDTFPLWYAQEVEGVRTDVRVVNLSLLQTDWYINQMRRAAYESAPVPFTIPEDKLRASKREVVYIMSRDSKPMKLKDALDFCVSDDPEKKYDNNGTLIDYIPSKDFWVYVDSMQVMKNKVISVKDTARLTKRISWDLGSRGYITKNDLMVLDLVAHNDWKRPIYFAVTTGGEAYVGLDKYFQLEGLAYRLVPIKQTEIEQSQGGRVNTEAMYKNMMEKFLWGGLDKPGVNLDETSMRMAGNLRMQMSILAQALINEGKNTKAKKVLDKCLTVIPEENVPYDGTIFTIAAAYYQIGEKQKAGELSKRLFDIFESDLGIYNKQKGNHRMAFQREMDQAKEIMKRLVGLTQQFKDEKLSKELMMRLSKVVPPEDLMPDDGRQQEPTQIDLK
jgi:hypothetical protein